VVSLGVGSLAHGLAAQDTLANMFAGFTLMLDRPFRVGDRIQLSTGEAGDVLAIGMRATQIRTYDATVLVVPNGVLVKDRLVNLSEPARSIVARVELTFAFGTDLDVARGVLVQAAAASPRVAADPPPVLLVTRFSELGIHATLVFHVADYTELGLARGEVQENAWRRLQAADIELAALRYDAAAARRGGGTT
jgi:MscS family membrane protein